MDTRLLLSVPVTVRNAHSMLSYHHCDFEFNIQDRGLEYKTRCSSWHHVAAQGIHHLTLVCHTHSLMPDTWPPNTPSHHTFISNLFLVTAWMGTFQYFSVTSVVTLKNIFKSLYGQGRGMHDRNWSIYINYFYIWVLVVKDWKHTQIKCLAFGWWSYWIETPEIQ